MGRPKHLSENAGNRAFDKLRIGLGIGLFLIVLGLVLQPATRNQFISSLFSLSLSDIILITILFGLMRLIQGAILLKTLVLHGFKISYWAALNLIGLKGAFNLAFSGLGLAAQTARAKQDLHLPIRIMVLATLTQSIMLVFAFGITLTTVTLALQSRASLPTPEVFILIGFIFGAFGIVGSIFCLQPNILPNKCLLSIHNRFCKPEKLEIYSDWRNWASLAIQNIILVLLRTIRVLAIAYAIDPEVSFESLSITVLAADTVGVIPITPGGIGLRELIIGMIGAVASQYETFLSAAIIDRVITITLNLMHGALAVLTSVRSSKVA